MSKQLVAVALSLAVATAVHAGEQEAYSGIAADAVTTGISLGVPGVVETNPLGWATLPIRLAITEHAKTLPREEGQPIMDAMSASGWGAAASNLLVLAGAGPVAPLVGVAVGYAVWKSGETEREFWRMCAVHKTMDPGVQCRFRAWKPEEVVQLAQEQQQLRAAAATHVMASAPAMVKVAARTDSAPAH